MTELTTEVSLAAGTALLWSIRIEDESSWTLLNIAIDETTMTATPNFMPIGWEYRNSPTTYLDWDSAILQMDINGYLKVSMDSDIQIGAVEIKDWNSDLRMDVSNVGSVNIANVWLFDSSGNQIDTFGGGGWGTSSGSTASALIGSDIGSYTFDASAQTVTLTGIKTFNISEILVITNITDQEIIYLPSDTGKGGTISGNIITLEFDTTSMSDTDDLQIFVQYNNDKDYNLWVQKFIDQAPIWARYTDPEAIISSAYEITASFADVGSEIDMRWYNRLGLWVTIDINTSVNPQIRILQKHTSAWSEEYREIYLSSPVSNKTTINLNDYEVDTDVDQLFFIPIKTANLIWFIQIQVKDDSNGTGQIDALYATKAFSF